jgi:2-oxoglutarate dehydrogenase E2 component (dihydrolipoamide succinyltransferase)
MSNIMDLRNEYKEAFEKQHKVKLGFMSAFVKVRPPFCLEATWCK